ncbi:MAG: helix-turn-helix domain-containing protein [Candidatus Rokuibacteriota bacterium]
MASSPQRNDQPTGERNARSSQLYADPLTLWTMEAARLLVQARRQAGISQAELARRAGLPRSVVNVYERNRRQPGVDIFARLLAAAGFELRIAPALRPVADERAARLLAQVLDLAEVMPARRRGPLAYPAFSRRAGPAR